MHSVFVQATCRSLDTTARTTRCAFSVFAGLFVLFCNCFCSSGFLGSGKSEDLKNAGAEHFPDFCILTRKTLEFLTAGIINITICYDVAQYSLVGDYRSLEKLAAPILRIVLSCQVSFPSYIPYCFPSTASVLSLSDTDRTRQQLWRCSQFSSFCPRRETTPSHEEGLHGSQGHFNDA